MRYKLSSIDQLVIDVHRHEEGIDGGCRLFERDETVATLLVQPAETRLAPFESRERALRRGHAAQQPLGDGHEQQRIPLLRGDLEQRLPCRQRLGKLLLPQHPADPRDVGHRKRLVGFHRCPPGVRPPGAP
jgi:hypothetical protein